MVILFRRIINWFVLLILLFCPIIHGEEISKVILEDFDEIYYMEDTWSV